jgi:hypothetical protein
MQISIFICLASGESAFDRFTAEFQKIIELVAENVRKGGQELCTSIGHFQFDMGIIPALHFIGTKCRWLLLRRKVLAILGSCYWREGLFDSYRSYRCIFRVMEAEEVGMNPGLISNAAELEEFASYLPPEPLRVYVVTFGPVPLYEAEQQLTLLLKPNRVFNAPVYFKTTIPASGKSPPLEPRLTWSP